MLLQTLLLVVTLAVIGSTLLTSTLVSAKSAFHALVMRQSRSAMNDATASFISWAQNNIKESGIEQLPLWAATPPVISPDPACSERLRRTSNEVSADCKFLRTISWRVTGYTDFDAATKSNAFSSEARNLATAQEERRISATINVAITNPNSSIAYAQQSRELTLRVFHAFPYVAVTAERDSTSESGSIASAEGDTAGYTKQDYHFISVAAKPILALPASYTDTVLLTTINCANTANNSYGDALLDNDQVIFTPVRPYGNLAWAYEVPCDPTQKVDPTTAPSGYRAPSNNLYGSTNTANDIWLKNDGNHSSFSR